MHADKRFLDKYMPQFMHHLHYRIIDVSTIKELSRQVTLGADLRIICYICLSGWRLHVESHG